MSENSMAIVPERGSKDEAILIREQLAPKATIAEIRVFLALCERLGLDPWARQIYLVGRWNKGAGGVVHTPQVSIDGFRLVAQRTGEYAGQAGPEWCADDGVWRDVWLSKDAPAAARVGVYRKGWAAPLYRVAVWSEFVQTDKSGAPTHMWRQFASVMLAKCAEMQALRAAFAAELSGVYGDAEMAQASSGVVVATLEPAPEVDPAVLEAISEELDAAAERGDATEVDRIAAKKLRPLQLDDAAKARMVRAYQMARAHAVKVATPAPDESESEGGCGSDNA